MWGQDVWDRCSRVVCLHGESRGAYMCAGYRGVYRGVYRGAGFWGGFLARSSAVAWHGDGSWLVARGSWRVYMRMHGEDAMMRDPVGSMHGEGVSMDMMYARVCLQVSRDGERVVGR